jgi:hypothetical protein
VHDFQNRLQRSCAHLKRMHRPTPLRGFSSLGRFFGCARCFEVIQIQRVPHGKNSVLGSGSKPAALNSARLQLDLKLYFFKEKS